jgi:lipoprotein-releasing system permease protein
MTGGGSARSLGWIGFVAGRHVRRGRRNSPSPVLAILGIATGVLALIVILAVMNGFQLGFIESILEISSYHVRAESFPPERSGELADTFTSLSGIVSAAPFREFQGLIRGRRGGQQGIVIRGLPPDARERDPGMASKLEFEAGSFDIAADNAILLGAELARALSVRLGDEVTLFSIAGLFSADDASDTADADSGSVNSFTVTGIFRSGFYEYDLGWGFIGIDTAEKLGAADLSLGLKLRDRWQDRQAVAAAGKALAGDGGFADISITTWRDYNRAFFGALRTEKLFMFLLVGLIFIVVGLNIFQAQRRAVLERREEIGLLRAVGAGDTAVRLIFVWDGFVIGLSGAGAGLVLGLFIATHIAVFFTIMETAVNWFIGIINFLSGSFAGAGDFAVFSPAVFYIKEIPSRIIPHEVILIFMFGFLSALLAAWFASGRVSRTRPAEVLRYE